MNNSVARRPRRLTEPGDNGLSSAAPALARSQSSSFVSACILFVAMVLFFGYLFGSSVFHHSKSDVDSAGKKFQPNLRVRTLPVTGSDDFEDGATDTSVEQSQFEASFVHQALPLVQDIYGTYMQKVLHIGPGSCDVIAKLLQDDNIQAWGVEPADMIHSSPLCKSLIRKGLVRVAEVHRTLPYRSKTFSLVLTTGTLEHLTSRQLNRTLPELARLTGHAVVVFIAGQPSILPDALTARQLQVAMKPIKHHNRTWWLQRFETAGLEEDEEMTKRFEALQSERSFTTSDYIFHLLPRQLD